MDSFWMKIYVFIGIVAIHTQIHRCHAEKRMLEFPPSWQPMPFPPGAQNLISVASLDVTNKEQLNQIAHHNAQILRQFKGMHPPVTQYHNPFPMFPAPNSHKHMMVQTNKVHQHANVRFPGPPKPPTEKFPTTPNLIGSSSNTAQTVFPKQNPFGNPQTPLYFGNKPDFGGIKFFNSFSSGTSKVPENLMNGVSPQHGFPSFSTTSRIPLLRDVTLGAPSSVYKSTQLPAPLLNKANSQSNLQARPNSPSLAVTSNQIPSHVISTYSHFGPASPVIHNAQHSKPRVKNNFGQASFDSHLFNNGYSGHMLPAPQFVNKNAFPNSIHYPAFGSGAYHLTNTFLPGTPAIKPNSEAFILSPQKTNLISLPTVPPSVLSPFFQQVQQQQQLDGYTNNGSPNDKRKPDHNKPTLDGYKVLTDEYSVHLVPPPVRNSNFQPILPTVQQPTQSLSEGPSIPPTMLISDEEHKKAMDILNKYNIPAISPLQDINRFNYNSKPFLPTLNSYPTAAPIAVYNTQSPHVFKQLLRKPDYDYKHHKQQHPSYTGARYPHDPLAKPTKKPFLPTPDTSPDLAITHSFFTIEDAITHAPHDRRRPGPSLHRVNPSEDFRRPVAVYPTNTNQIEDNLRKPQEEHFTEISTVNHGGSDTTLQPPPSAPALPPQRPKNRTKLRRKRPRPTAESNQDKSNEQNSNTYTPPNRHRYNENAEEYTTRPSIPKNHREYPLSTVSQEPIVSQFPKETTLDDVSIETTTAISYHRPVVPQRNRPTNDVEGSTKAQRTKDAQRRPNNRFEDNKIPRYRQPTTTLRSTFSNPLDDVEATTVSHIPRYKVQRRPITTQHPVAVTASSVDEEDTVTDFKITPADEVYSQTRAPSRTRPQSTATTPLSSTTHRAIATSTHPQASPEDNAVVISTKIGVNSDSKFTTEQEFISEEEEEEHHGANRPLNTGEVTTPSSTTTAATNNESIEPSTSEKVKESVSTSSETPVYRPMDQLKQRHRMKQKEKLMEAAEKHSTSTRVSFPTKSRHHPTTASTTTDKNNAVHEDRLPLHKGTVKIVEVSPDRENATKSNRLNLNSSKYDAKNRPRFSVKEYRNRLSTTTADPSQPHQSSEATTASYTKLRFPTRNRFYLQYSNKNKTQETAKPSGDDEQNLVVENNEKIVNGGVSTEDTSSEQTDTVTRKRFQPKDRYSSKVKPTTDGALSGQASDTITVKPTTRRGSTRHDFSNRKRYSTTTPASATTDSTTSHITRLTSPPRNGTSAASRRPVNNISLRQRIQTPKRKDTVSEETINDLAIEATSEEHQQHVPVSSTEQYKHETAIMKIAKDDHSYRPHMHRTTPSTATSATTLVTSTATAVTSPFADHTDTDSDSDSDFSLLSSPSSPSTSSESSIDAIVENDLSESPSHQSERVAELTIFGSDQFNTVNKGSSSRRVPGYFTIATEDPILPIEAFFPQVKRN